LEEKNNQKVEEKRKIKKGAITISHQRRRRARDKPEEGNAERHIQEILITLGRCWRSVTGGKRCIHELFVERGKLRAKGKPMKRKKIASVSLSSSGDL